VMMIFCFAMGGQLSNLFTFSNYVETMEHKSTFGQLNLTTLRWQELGELPEPFLFVSTAIPLTPVDILLIGYNVSAPWIASYNGTRVETIWQPLFDNTVDVFYPGTFDEFQQMVYFPVLHYYEDDVELISIELANQVVESLANFSFPGGYITVRSSAFNDFQRAVYLIFEVGKGGNYDEFFAAVDVDSKETIFIEKWQDFYVELAVYSPFTKEIVLFGSSSNNSKGLFLASTGIMNKDGSISSIQTISDQDRYFLFNAVAYDQNSDNFILSASYPTENEFDLLFYNAMKKNSTLYNLHSSAIFTNFTAWFVQY